MADELVSWQTSEVTVLVKAEHCTDSASDACSLFAHHLDVGNMRSYTSQLSRATLLRQSGYTLGFATHF